MRLLALGALNSFVITLVAAGALRAGDPTLSVAAVAAVVVLLTWFARLHATDEQSSFGLIGPGSAATLAVVNRLDRSTILPVLTAHAVGAVAAGAAALGLGDRRGEPIVFDTPTPLVAGIGAALVGLIGAWTTLGLDAGGSDALAAVPGLVSGGVLPVGLLVAFSPSALLGLATADLLTWDVALVAAGASLVGAVAGGFTVGLLLPADQ